MASKILVVPELRIDVDTGPTCYPSEGGFSARSAEVAAIDPSLIQQLTDACTLGETVKLECGGVRVTGKITKRTRLGENKCYFVLVEPDEITYQKPRHWIP